MWNDINTAKYEGMIAETVAFANGKGRKIRAYLSEDFLRYILENYVRRDFLQGVLS